MGKSYRRDSGNDRWRKKGFQRHDKRNKNNRPKFPDVEDPTKEKPSYAPSQDTLEYHESFA